MMDDDAPARLFSETLSDSEKVKAAARIAEQVDPSHYKQDPSGVECIQVTRHKNYNVGNAIKYLWRLGLKKTEESEREASILDLEKARWYITDEIERLRNL